MATNNSTIMGRIYMNGSNDFAQRVPDPTQASMAQVSEAIFAPQNNIIYNEFCATLINRVGQTWLEQKSFENPLAEFKKASTRYGSSWQILAPKWIKAHSYMDSDETLLKMNRPDYAQAFVSLDRRDRYDIDFTRAELQQAFLDEFGLNNFVDATMSAVYNSANYDEYKIMLETIATHAKNHGFYNVHLSAIPSDEATGKEFLKAVRTVTGKLRFPSTLYNALDVNDIPVFAKADELMLLTTPDVLASVSVDVLAAAFNIEQADIQSRIVLVDEFPMPDVCALLTTKDFFVVSDVINETGSWFNPQTLTEKYYYHIQQIVGVNPFVPAVTFGTAEATNVEVVTVTPAALELTSASDTVEPGGTVQLTAKLTGTVTDNDNEIVVAPDSCTYEITLKDAVINSRTYVDRLGVLHVQKSIEAADEITVTAKSTYTNPSGATSTYAASKVITVA